MTGLPTRQPVAAVYSCTPRGRQIFRRIAKKQAKQKTKEKKRGHNPQKWHCRSDCLTFFPIESFRDHGPKSDAGGNRPKLPNKSLNSSRMSIETYTRVLCLYITCTYKFPRT